jgi:hypothetical protein
MTAKWGICACVVVCLALLAGCRTPQPVLKPDKEAEKLVEPPNMTKYSTTGLPDQAFDKPEDPGKKAMDAKLPGNNGAPRSMPSMSAGSRY